MKQLAVRSGRGGEGGLGTFPKEHHAPRPAAMDLGALQPSLGRDGFEFLDGPSSADTYGAIVMDDGATGDEAAHEPGDSKPKAAAAEVGNDEGLFGPRGHLAESGDSLRTVEVVEEERIGDDVAGFIVLAPGRFWTNILLNAAELGMAIAVSAIPYVGVVVSVFLMPLIWFIWTLAYVRQTRNPAVSPLQVTNFTPNTATA